MQTHLTLFLFSFLLSSLLTPCLSATSPLCHPDDYKALIDFKTFLNNSFPSWVPNTDCCNWYGIGCDYKTNRVILVEIFSGQLSGQIPPVVAKLTYLENFTFRKLSNVTGSVPRSITKLKHLKLLRLDRLNLTGPVPDFLSELTTLNFLDLSFNQFTGPIPPSFSKFTQLDALHLDRNKLTGSIPESLGHFTGKIPSLYLSHNQLTGSIPKSFANLDFATIDLSRNVLVGDASMLFKPNATIDVGDQFIDLSRNMLEFDFSKEKFQPSLRSLDLNHNKIYGSIPKGIVALRFFNVSYNRLCGEIPTGGNMDYSAYIHNRCLCGSPLMIKCK